MEGFVARTDWTPGLLRHLSERGPVLFNMEALLSRSVKSCPAEGLLLEFGVHDGGSLRYIASLTPRTVYGFDSFLGLPEDWDSANPKGHFDRGGIPPDDLPHNVECVVGWFETTLPAFLAARPDPVAFAHVDSDLYSSAKTVLTHVGPRLAPGAVLNFHEFWNFPGEREGEALALAEWLNANPRRVLPLGRCGDCYSQAAFVVAPVD